MSRNCKLRYVACQRCKEFECVQPLSFTYYKYHVYSNPKSTLEPEETLPEEMWMKICFHLDNCDLKCLQKTCQYFKQLIKDEYINAREVRDWGPFD